MSSSPFADVVIGAFLAEEFQKLGDVMATTVMEVEEFARDLPEASS